MEIQLKKLKGFKDIEYLGKLSTKRLLSYYKARRQDRIGFINSNTCDCCGELYWHLYDDEDYKQELNILSIIDNHLKEVKELLNTREHVKR